MAQIWPDTSTASYGGAGAHREREVLNLLADGLPTGFDLFHNLYWSAMHGGEQGFGELDITVMAPDGGLLLLEVKSGALEVDANGVLSKRYNGTCSDVGHQMRRQHSALLQRMQEGTLPRAPVGTLLVLPDWRVQGSILSVPPDRIVDADDLEQLCLRVRQALRPAGLDAEQRQTLTNFLANRLQVAISVDGRIGLAQRTAKQLSSGLATWVPRIEHAAGLYVIEATAGSGKTQLAMQLLNSARTDGQRARYVCFNRPLADFLAPLAPTAEVTTFHQLCRDHAERAGEFLDFSNPEVFRSMTGRYVAEAADLPQTLDLLVIDESQDIDPEWVVALHAQLKPGGRLYLMGDVAQRVYAREPFDLDGAVNLHCNDNFRSPVRVVDAINQLGLCKEEVLALSGRMGQSPGFHTWAAGEVSAEGALKHCLEQLWQQGYQCERQKCGNANKVSRSWNFSAAMGEHLQSGFSAK